MNVLHAEYIRWSQEKGGACSGLLMFLHVVSVVTLCSLSNDAGLVIWIYKHSQPANVRLVVDPGQHL